MAYHGTPRLKFVDPSSGSITTSGPGPVPLSPLSSDRTRNPAAVSIETATPSVTTSIAYWPMRAPEGPRSVAPSSCSRTASATSWNSIKTGSLTPGTVVSTSCAAVGPRTERMPVAVIDVAGFVADLKSQAIDHGFHVHDERHFVETYSLRQLWEVDLHPEEACSGPIDLHLSLDVDPRAMLGFEDEVMKLEDVDEPPPAGFTFPLVFTWTLPPLPEPPDLLVLATELAGIGGVELPVEVSAIDSFPSVTDAPERSLSMVARTSVDLADVYLNNDDAVADNLDRCKHVSLFLLDRAKDWLGDL